MEYKNVYQGGCDLTWRIEKCNLFKSVYVSPNFFLSQSQKSECYLELDYRDSFYFCYLKPSDILGSTTVYFDACISSDDESGKRSGLQTFPGEEPAQLASLSLQEKTPFRSLLIRAHLKDISDPASSLHRLSFRSVVETDTRKVNYEIPFYNVWASNSDVFIRVTPVFPHSIPFEMNIGTNYEADIDKILQIDISQSSQIEKIGFFCKVTCEDPNGESIGSATRFHVFEKESGSTCSLKFSFDESTTSSFYLDKYVLSLKCEFSTTEGKSASWIEKSAILPGPDESIDSGISEKERDGEGEDYHCLYLEGKNTDVVIIAEGRKFLAHKTVLRERSPVFAAMFDSDMMEKESNTVEIVDTEAETLDQMLFFIYSKTLKTEEYENIFKLYEAADKYQLLTLKEKCLMVLKINLNTQNAIELLILADAHHERELQLNYLFSPMLEQYLIQKTGKR